MASLLDNLPGWNRWPLALWRTLRRASPLLMVGLLAACAPGSAGQPEDPGSAPPTPLPAAKIPGPAPTTPALPFIPVPVLTAVPTSTPFPQSIPRYASRCATPPPRPYPQAHQYVGYLTPTPGAEMVIAASFDSWCYQVNRIAGLLVMDVSYDRSTAAGLDSFAAANREIARQLAQTQGRAYLLAYFREPLLPDDFRRWARENDVWVEMALGDCSNCPTGGLGWLMATRDDPYPSRGDLEEQYHLVVAGLWGSVGTARLSEIASSQPVYIADLTSNIVQRELDAIASPDAQYLQKIPYFEEMPIWPMRELGIQRFMYER